MTRTASPLQIAAIFSVWLLLTASVTTLNLLIGIGIALLIPPLSARKTDRTNLLAMVMKIPATTIQGIREGLQLPLEGLRERPTVRTESWPRWASGRDPILRFSWLVMTAFTPRTLVLSTSRDQLVIHLEKQP